MKDGKRIAALIAAAGESSRMGSHVPKQYMEIDGKTVMEKSIEAFSIHEEIDEIWVAVKPDDISFCREKIKLDKVKDFVAGGKTRQESIYNLLKAMESDPPYYCLIHDGARPFVTQEIIDRIIEKIPHTGAAIPGIDVTDTIKLKRNDGFLGENIDRSLLLAVQTPQGYRYDFIKEAYEKAKVAMIDVTDDSALMDRLGYSVSVVEGDRRNIKITKPEDIQGLRRHEVIIPKVGIGKDVHRLVEGRRLILGGVEIPFEKGLLGHSDADVLSHAIIDALLGAAAEGDIGRLFPSSDDAYKDISSLRLLSAVSDKLEECELEIANIDATISAERPKLEKYIDIMKERISAALRISDDKVNVKATTTEGLGYCGRGEGISAIAIASLIKKN